MSPISCPLAARRPNLSVNALLDIIAQSGGAMPEEDDVENKTVQR